MSNSSLVNYTRISPNSNNPRNNSIRKITIHHCAGNLTVEQIGSVFAPSYRQASSNYGIDGTGRVGLYVDENNRSWASSSAANDNQAITIEVANDEIGGNWHVSDTAYNKLIDLCVDICQRNGISRLNWTGGADGNLTCHYMFAATACPGPYLKSKMSEIANAVNTRLSGGNYTPAPSPTPQPTQSGSTSGFDGGTYVCNVDKLNVRDAPSMSGSVVASYGRGETVNLDSWYTVKDGYVWSRYTSYSGLTRYVAVGPHTGKAEANDYLIKQGGAVAAASTPAPAPAPAQSVSKSGTIAAGAYRCNVDTLNVRSAPSMSGSVVAQYHAGETVNLDGWYTVADGYVWGRYTSYSGATRYVAIGKPTGGYDPSDYLVKI